jgi:hypothetical protein
LVETGFGKLFAWLALNSDSFDLHLPSSWDYRLEPLCPGPLPYLLNEDNPFFAGSPEDYR